MPNLNFLAWTVSEICRESQNSKSTRPLHDPLRRNFYFLSWEPLAVNLLATFEVSSFNRFRNTEAEFLQTELVWACLSSQSR